MIDLNNVVNSTSGLTLRAALAINDAGQIAGWATNSIGSEFGILTDTRSRALHHRAFARLCRLPVELRLAAAITQLVKRASQSKVRNQRAIHCEWHVVQQGVSDPHDSRARAGPSAESGIGGAAPFPSAAKMLHF